MSKRLACVVGLDYHTRVVSIDCYAALIVLVKDELTASMDPSFYWLGNISQKPISSCVFLVISTKDAAKMVCSTYSSRVYKHIDKFLYPLRRLLGDTLLDKF